MPDARQHAPPAPPAAATDSDPGSSADGDPDPSAPARDAPPLSPRVEVEVHLHADDTDPPTEGWLLDRLREAVARCGVTDGRLDVSIIDDDRMRRLHAEHRDDPTTTDVLTFDLRDTADTNDDATGVIDGDIMVCRDEAQRQAASRGHDARTELLLYCVHGLLHLLGEDDHEDDDYHHMHEREDALLGAMGLGSVFRSGADASSPVTARHGNGVAR